METLQDSDLCLDYPYLDIQKRDVINKELGQFLIIKCNLSTSLNTTTLDFLKERLADFIIDRDKRIIKETYSGT